MIRRRAALELAALALGVATAAAALPACKKSRHDGAHADLPLDQTYTTKTRLLTLHYPKDMVANAAGDHSAALAPTPLGALHRESEAYFTANMAPVSNEVTEYARVILDTLARGKTDYRELSRQRKICFRDVEGIEHVATFTDHGRTFRRWSCTFLAGGHGYSFGFFVAVPDGEDDEVLLQKIVSSTEIAR